MKKFILYFIIALFLFFFIFIFYVKFNDLFFGNRETTPAEMNNEQITDRDAESEIGNSIEITKGIREIENDNVVGTVEWADEKNISVKTDSGSVKTFFVDAKNVFVVIESDANMENGGISDIKEGKKIFLHFDKETNFVKNITLSQ